MLRLALINHLLQERDDLHPYLRHHAGKTGRIAVPPLALDFRLDEAGILQAAGDTPPEATLTISAWLLPRFLLGDAAARREVVLEGDAAFAADLAQVLQALEWDAERDLARWTGDVLAQSVFATARRLFDEPDRVAASVSQATVEYLQEEAGILVNRASVNAFIAEVDELRDTLARLEKRVDHLLPGIDQS